MLNYQRVLNHPGSGTLSPRLPIVSFWGQPKLWPIVSPSCRLTAQIWDTSIFSIHFGRPVVWLVADRGIITCEAKVRFRFRFIIVKHSRWIEIWHHLLITWGFLVDIPLDRVAGHVFWSWWETWSRPCSQPSARCASSGDDKGTPSNQGVHFQHATPPCRFKLTGNATISSVDHSDIWNSSPATPFAPWWMQGVPILPVFWCWMPPAILQSCTGCKKLPQFSVQVTLMHPAPHPEVAQWLNDCKLWRFGSKPAQKKLRNHWATISSSLFPSLALRTAS